jgi:hypothetical protein
MEHKIWQRTLSENRTKIIEKGGSMKKGLFYKKQWVRKMTEEDFKRNIKFWQSRKAKARKVIRQNIGVGLPIFQTCVPEFNKAFEKKSKDKIEWANDEIRFPDKNINYLKKMKKVI